MFRFKRFPHVRWQLPTHQGIEDPAVALDHLDYRVDKRAERLPRPVRQVELSDDLIEIGHRLPRGEREQVVAVLEVAIERAHTYPGAVRDHRDLRRGAVLGEDSGRGLDDLETIRGGIRAQRGSRFVGNHGRLSWDGLTGNGIPLTVEKAEFRFLILSGKHRGQQPWADSSPGSPNSYRKAWLVIVAVGLIAGFGGYTVTNVRQELIPDIELPVLVVIASDPGARSTEVEGSVTVPLETAFEALDGVESMESKTVDNLSLVTLSYDFGANLNQAEANVRAALDTAVLPADVTTSLLKFDPTLLPIVEFSLRGDLDQSALLELAGRDIVPTLESLDGVASVEVVGGAVREVVIALDWDDLLAAGLTYEDVANALQSNNVLLPSGSIVTGDGDTPIETVVRYQGLDDIRDLQIPRLGETPVRLGDIAEVEDEQGGSVGITRSDGQSAVGIRVTKEKDANTVHTANRVTSELDDLGSALPAGVTLTVFQDQSEFITESIIGLVEEGALGGILAVVVVFIFLSNWRTTLVTAVSIRSRSSRRSSCSTSLATRSTS